jgi:hypothetical protein
MSAFDPKRTFGPIPCWHKADVVKRDAIAAWRRFVLPVKSLPPDQAAPFWQAALTEVAAMAHG